MNDYEEAFIGRVFTPTVKWRTRCSGDAAVLIAVLAIGALMLAGVL